MWQSRGATFAVTFTNLIQSFTAMDTPIVISDTMLRRLRHMTAEENRTLLLALVDDELLHTPHTPMSAEMELYYMMFRHGVMRESGRLAHTDCPPADVGRYPSFAQG